MYNLQTIKSLKWYKKYTNRTFHIYIYIYIYIYISILQGLKYKVMVKLFWTYPRYITWFKDSTHIIYWLTKWLKKSLEQFTDQIKKAKKVPESWKWTFHKMQYLMLSNINIASVSEHLRKKLWNLQTRLIQFTDQKI